MRQLDTPRRFPDIAGLITLQADLHQHTVFSDGIVWPHVRVAEARADGVDVIAISDHLEWQPHEADIHHPDRNRGFEIAHSAGELPEGLSEGDHWILQRRAAGDCAAVAAQRIIRASDEPGPTPAPERPILVLRGAEITRGEPDLGQPALGHINAVNLTDINRLLLPDPVDVLRETWRQDGFAIWNHPWSSPAPADGVSRCDSWHADLMAQGLIGGIEIVNDRTFSAAAFQIGLDHGLTLIGSSDIHGLISDRYPADQDLHRPTTVIFADDRTDAAVGRALHERRTVVCFGNTVIGRPHWVLPLLEASLSMESGHYVPAPTDFSLQRRPATCVLRVVVANDCGLDLLLRHTGPHSLTSHPGPVVVPAHGSTTINVLTDQRVDHIELPFEVLSALVAPQHHPEIVLHAPVAVG